MFKDRNIKPMLLKEVDKPFNDTNYIYELKFDGYRVIIYVSPNSFNILSRNGNDITYLYPELRDIQKIVSTKVIFDGEIIVNGGSFSDLQIRSHLKDFNKIKKMQKKLPVSFVVFDILYENKNLMMLPLYKRKEVLLKYPETDFFIHSKIYSDGIKLFSLIKKRGLEGIVAKKKDGLYYHSKRTDECVKIKNFKKQEFYVHGYVKNKMKFSLLLGEYRNNLFYYVGKVSIMPDNEIFNDIKRVPKSKNKFVNYNNEASYIQIKYKILVHFMERTHDYVLRQPFLK